jgi:hypothetical protein
MGYFFVVASVDVTGSPANEFRPIVPATIPAGTAPAIARKLRREIELPFDFDLIFLIVMPMILAAERRR